MCDVEWEAAFDVMDCQDDVGISLDHLLRVARQDAAFLHCYLVVTPVFNFLGCHVQLVHMGD